MGCTRSCAAPASAKCSSSISGCPTEASKFARRSVAEGGSAPEAGMDKAENLGNQGLASQAGMVMKEENLPKVASASVSTLATPPTLALAPTLLRSPVLAQTPHVQSSLPGETRQAFNESVTGDIIVALQEGERLGVVWAPDSLTLLLVFAATPADSARLHQFVGRTCTHINNSVVTCSGDLPPFLNQPRPCSLMLRFAEKATWPRCIRESGYFKILQHYADSHGITFGDWSSLCDAEWVDPSNFAPEDICYVVRRKTGDLIQQAPPTPIRASIPPTPGQRGITAFDDSAFGEQLACGAMAVVKASYFEDCWAEQIPYQDRQNIPQKCFISGDCVRRRWDAFGANFLTIISYAWLSKEHPDPNMFHLSRLDRVFQELKAFLAVEFPQGRPRGRGGGNPHLGQLDQILGKDRELFHPILDDIGVIIDFCSLWQKQGEAERTDFQNEQFKKGLKEMNVPYASSEVLTIMLIAVPTVEKRKFHDRGWTYFESAVISGKSPPDRYYKNEHNVLCFGDTFDPDREEQHGRDFMKKFAALERQAPCTPTRFEKQMKERETRAKTKGVDFFTNGKDHPLVFELYNKAFQCLARETKLLYEDLGWGDDEVTSLSEVLPHYKDLRSLELIRMQITSIGAEKLAEAFSSMPSLAFLRLDGSKLDGVGIDENIIAALPNLTGLQSLEISGNQIDDVGVMKLASALPQMRNLRKLVLARNSIGDRGAEKLAEALPLTGQLQVIDLQRNEIGDVGAEKLAEALGHINLETLLVEETKISNMCALRMEGVMRKRNSAGTVWYSGRPVQRRDSWEQGIMDDITSGPGPIRHQPRFSVNVMVG